MIKEGLEFVDPNHLYPGKSPSDLSDIKPFVIGGRIKQLPHVHLFFFNYTKFMNLALMRASKFIEGAIDLKVNKKGIKNRKDMLTHVEVLRNLNSSAAHDLMAADLLRYWDVYSSMHRKFGLPKSPEKAQLLQIETDFWENVLLPIVHKDSKAVILAVPLDYWAFVGSVTHELVHGVYFSDPLYREAIDDFWGNKVSKYYRRIITKQLSEFYDIRKPTLLQNEFQAHVLTDKPICFGKVYCGNEAWERRLSNPLRDHLRLWGFEGLPLEINNPIEASGIKFCKSYLLQLGLPK